MKAQLTQEAKAALIKAIHDGHEDYEMEWDNNHNEGLAHAISTVESFPVSDGCKPNPTDNWIPCSERLPKESELVMVYGRKSQSSFGIQFATFHDLLNSNAFYDDEGFELIVTNWQPIPKPPTE